MAGVVVSLAVCLLGLLVVYRCLAAWGLRAPGGLARHAVEEGPPAAQGLQPGWKIFLLGRWLPGGAAPGGDGGGYTPLGRGPHLGGGFPAAPALGRRPLHPPDRGGLPGLHGKRPAPVSGVLPGVRVGGPAAAAGDSLHSPGGDGPLLPVLRRRLLLPLPPGRGGLQRPDGPGRAAVHVPVPLLLFLRPGDDRGPVFAGHHRGLLVRLAGEVAGLWALWGAGRPHPDDRPAGDCCGGHPAAGGLPALGAAGGEVPGPLLEAPCCCGCP